MCTLACIIERLPYIYIYITKFLTRNFGSIHSSCIVNLMLLNRAVLSVPNPVCIFLLVNAQILDVNQTSLQVGYRAVLKIGYK